MSCRAGARQVVGVDVVGEDIVLAPQHRRASAQTRLRRAVFPVWRMDAGHAQHAGPHACAPQLAHAALGVHPSHRAGGGGRRGARLAHPGPRAVAIDSAGRGIHQGAWRRAQAQSAHQRARAGVFGASLRRRRQMQHLRRQPGQAAQRGRIVQVAAQRLGAELAQFGHAFGAGGERQDAQPRRDAALRQGPQHAHAHVAAAHDEQPRAAKARRQCARRALV